MPLALVVPGALVLLAELASVPVVAQVCSTEVQLSRRQRARFLFVRLPGWCRLRFVRFERRPAQSLVVQAGAAGPCLLFVCPQQLEAVPPRVPAPPRLAPLERWLQVGAVALERPAGGWSTSQFAISLSAIVATSKAASELGDRINMGVWLRMVSRTLASRRMIPASGGEILRNPWHALNKVW